MHECEGGRTYWVAYFPCPFCSFADHLFAHLEFGSVMNMLCIRSNFDLCCKIAGMCLLRLNRGGRCIRLAVHLAEHLARYPAPLSSMLAYLPCPFLSLQVLRSLSCILLSSLYLPPTIKPLQSGHVPNALVPHPPSSRALSLSLSLCPFLSLQVFLSPSPALSILQISAFLLTSNHHQAGRLQKNQPGWDIKPHWPRLE